MIDFSKIYCKTHPYELVNNFCSEKSCLVGLCATCICQHTQMHNHHRTQPRYENIRATYSRVHDNIQTQIETITNDKERLSNLFDSIKGKKQKLKGIFLKARNDCIQLVNDHYDELEKKWVQQITNQQKKNVLHNNYKLENLSTLLMKEISSLIDEAGKMNQPGFVDEISRIQKVVLVQSNDFHRKVSEEMEENEKYTPIIHYKPEHLNDLAFCLKRLLSLQFSIPLKTYFSSPYNAGGSETRQIIQHCQVNQPSHELMRNQSMVLRRVSSTEKMNHQPANQSMLWNVPKVLTTSHFNESNYMSNKSEVLGHSAMNRINFSPNYFQAGLSNFSKIGANKSQLKQKKLGLTITSTQSQTSSMAEQKQNSK